MRKSDQERINPPVKTSSVPTFPPFLGRSIRVLPLMPLQLPLALMLRSLVARHPRIFERLGAHAEKRFGIKPTDLPFAFVLEPRPQAPGIVAVRSLPHDIPVRIAGPLIGLLGLIDGSYDGDALFFSRDLVIEGDVEAVVALRNAIDSEDVDLVADAAALLGPLAPLGRLLLGHVQSRVRPAGVEPYVGAKRWS
jgi:predicted lipid carrier protein YhbT